MGTNYIIDAFLVVVVGGLGQLKGAVIAAFALGILNSFVEYSTTASIAKVIVFVVIVVFLQVRPRACSPSGRGASYEHPDDVAATRALGGIRAGRARCCSSSPPRLSATSG